MTIITIDPSLAATPVDVEPMRIACALKVVVEGAEVTAIEGVYRVVAVTYIGAGSFRASFSRSLGAVEPYIIPGNGAAVSILKWGNDHAVFETRDYASGELITPASFGFSLYI